MTTAANMDRRESNRRARTVAEALARGRRWLLASHVNPDGDALGALIGLGLVLEQAGVEAVMYNHSGVPRVYAFLPGAGRIVSEAPEPDGFDGIVILDSGAADRIGPLFGRLAEFKKVINVDHHLSRAPWGDPAWMDPGYEAVGTMVLKLARLIPAKITPEAAANLYVALMTDTGGFRHGNTTPASLAAAATLSELGADPGLLARKVYQTYSQGRLQLMSRVLGTLDIVEQGRLGFMAVSRADFQETGTDQSDMDNFVDLARGVESVEVAATLREEPGGYKISLRSKGLVDVARVAAGFGGGGHRSAAGGFISEDLGKAKKLIAAAVRDALERDASG